MERLPIEIRKEIGDRYRTLLSEKRNQRIREVFVKKQLNIHDEELLSMAVRMGSLQAVKIALENYEGNLWSEHICAACGFGNLRIVDYLINYPRFDQSDIDAFFSDFVRSSIKNDHLPIVKLLVAHDKKSLPTALHLAVRYDKLEVIDFVTNRIVEEIPGFFQNHENTKPLLKYILNEKKWRSLNQMLFSITSNRFIYYPCATVFAILFIINYGFSFYRRMKNYIFH